jgi:ABC-type antimicrobial peptide transport system permease subunit
VRDFTEEPQGALYLFLQAVSAVLVFILLIIAANVANLILARTFSRSTELAIRAALGATRARLVAQIFVEVLVLAVAAAAVGLALAQAFLRWIGRSVEGVPFWISFELGAGTPAAARSSDGSWDRR